MRHRWTEADFSPALAICSRAEIILLGGAREIAEFVDVDIDFERWQSL